MTKVVFSGGAPKRQNADLLSEVSKLKQRNTQLLCQLNLEAARKILLTKEEQINQAVRLQLQNLRESLSEVWTKVHWKRVLKYKVVNYVEPRLACQTC